MSKSKKTDKTAGAPEAALEKGEITQKEYVLDVLSAMDNSPELLIGNYKSIRQLSRESYFANLHVARHQDEEVAKVQGDVLIKHYWGKRFNQQQLRRTRESFAKAQKVEHPDVRNPAAQAPCPGQVGSMPRPPWRGSAPITQ